MKRKLRIVLVGLIGVVTIVATALGAAYYASQQVRPFYVEAEQIESSSLDEGRRELESRATALYSDAQQAGGWRAAFNTDQINGWLATNYADADDGSEDEIVAPRVAIGDDTITLGFRSRRGGLDTVISVDATAFITETGTIAVHFTSLKAGALPLPVMQVAEELASACRELSLPVRWTQQSGQPVAIVDLSQNSAADSPIVHVDTIELRDDTLYIAGHTDDPDKATSP